MHGEILPQGVQEQLRDEYELQVGIESEINLKALQEALGRKAIEG